MNFQVFLCLCALTGVFGDEAKEMEQVSVTEGQNVTLPTGVSVCEIRDQIIWYSGSETEGRIIAQIIAGEAPNDDRFRDRLHMNETSGDLNIPNVTLEDTGLYSVQIIINRTESWKNRTLTVYTRLPDPVITDCPQNSSNPQCVLSCSVKNGSQGQTLSLYKKHSVVDIKSLSDPNTGFNLSQEVDCQDKNIYSCVVSNSLTNKTTQFNSTHHCHYSEATSYMRVWGVVTGLLLGAVVLGAVLLGAVVAVIFCCYKKPRRVGYIPGKQIELEEVVSGGE